MTVLYLLCSFSMFMTMIFFASGVCENGCAIEKAGILSIVSGFFFMIAAAMAYKSAPMDKSVPKSTCCCCPAPISPAALDESAYRAVPVKEETSVKHAAEEKSLVVEEAQEEPASES